MPPDLALSSTLIGSNYPCLELIFMVPKVFEPLKFDCIWYMWIREDTLFVVQMEMRGIHVYGTDACIEPFKRQIKIAADDILIFYFYISKEIRLDFSCESSA